MSLFQSLFDLLNTYVFGGLASTAGSYYELVCILGATIGNVLLIALPFVLVFKIIVGVLNR